MLITQVDGLVVVLCCLPLVGTVSALAFAKGRALVMAV